MVRRELEQDAGQMIDSAKQLTDWREYVRAYPWACVGGAAALGFLVAPAHASSSRRRGGDDEATAAATGTVAGLVVATLGKAALTFATRSAMNYLARQERDPGGAPEHVQQETA